MNIGDTILLEFSYKALSFSAVSILLKTGAGFYSSLYMLSQ